MSPPLSHVARRTTPASDPGRPAAASATGSAPSGAKAMVQPEASRTSAVAPQDAAEPLDGLGFGERSVEHAQRLDKQPSDVDLGSGAERAPLAVRDRSRQGSARPGNDARRAGDEHASAAGALGRVLGRVRCTEQVGRPAVAGAEGGDAARDAKRGPVSQQAAQEDVRDLACAAIVDAVQQDAELVAADAADHRALEAFDGLLERERDGAQGTIARLVAVVVVDLLEVVDVAQQKCEIGAFIPRLQDGELERLVERPPVREPGQSVVVRQFRDAREDLGSSDRPHRSGR